MIPQEIIDKSKPLKNGWLIEKFELPIAKFIYLYKHHTATDLIFVTGVKNYEKLDVLEKYVDEIDALLHKIDNKKLYIEDLNGIENFNQLLFIPYSFSIIPKYYPDDYHNKEIQVMPIYKNEIGGNESIKEMKNILTSYLSPVDWSRKPQPKMQYRFKNPAHKYGTVGEGFVIDKEENAYSALRNFSSDKCFMDIKNIHLNEMNIRYERKTKNYIINGNEKMNFDEVSELIAVFLRADK